LSSDIIEGIIKGFQLIFSMDPTLVEITFRSLLVSGLATLMSLLWSIPIGILVGLGNFQGRSIFKSIFNALTGVPTVSLGLILYLLLSHRGVLGFLGLLYTPWAIIIGQALLITPIVISMVVSRLESTDPSIEELALTLGASDLQVKITILREAISGLLLAVTVSFNRALSELGVALMLGGNIR
jgi:tungstate transport system permease protein